MSNADLFISQYQSLYFACHRRHLVDPQSGRLISEQQLNVLAHLDAVRQTKVGELAAHLGLSHSSVSISLGRLARDGYVTRSASAADGRVTFVLLTEDGERVRDAQRVLEPDLVAALFRRLAPPERRAARLGLAALSRAAHELVALRAAERRARRDVA